MASKTAAPVVSVDATHVSPFGVPVDVIDELAILDKAEVVGRPLIVTDVMVYTNGRGVEILDVDVEFEDGETATVKDSSTTGVKGQIMTLLETRGVTLTAGELYHFERPIYCPAGLRVSVYEVQDERGRAKMARTYYLTTSGRRKR